MISLEDSLFYAAGYHDGLTQRVDYGRADSSYIEKHEAIHDRIFYGTADGLLHILAVRALHNPASGLPEDRRVALAGFIRALTDETRWAHECAATYLGLKDTGSVEARRVAYDHMNEEYRRYYEVYEALIDRQVTSIFAQFALGWALTYFAFGSRRIEWAAHRLASVEAWDAAAAGAVLHVDGPGRRLRNAIAAIENTPDFFRTLLEDAQGALANGGVTRLSLADDDHWSRTYIADPDEAEIVDQFLIRFALARIAEAAGGELVRPDFRDLPEVRSLSVKLGARSHFQTTLHARFEKNADLAARHIADLAATADRQRRIGHPPELGEFDEAMFDRVQGMQDFSARIFTLGGWRRGAADEEISVLCYARDDLLGDPLLEFSGWIERRRLDRFFSCVLAKMLQCQISYPVMIVENFCGASHEAKSGSWILGDRPPEFFQILPFLRAEQTCTTTLPIMPSITLFRYCADDWSAILGCLTGRLFQIGSTPAWQGWKEVEPGIHESVPGQQIAPSGKDFIATLLSHPDHRHTHFRIMELETYRLYQPLMTSLEGCRSIESAVSANAGDEIAKLMRFAIFTARDLFPLL